MAKKKRNQRATPDGDIERTDVCFPVGEGEFKSGYDAGYDGKEFLPTSPTYVNGFERGRFAARLVRKGARGKVGG